MSRLLKKAKEKNPKVDISKYEEYGLTDNPFPNTPFVNKDNNDIRLNGSIYEGRIRNEEYNQFLNKFLKVPQSDLLHTRLGYVHDQSYVGRGNGKSTFALNLIDKINEDYCLDISNEVNKCFGLYISPEPGGRTKTFDNFVDLIFNAIIELNLVNYSLAALRLEALVKLEIIKEEELPRIFPTDNDIVEKLNSNKWFQERNIVIRDITVEIFEANNQLDSVKPDVPFKSDLNNFFNHFITNQSHFKDFYWNTLKKGQERFNFIFNDLILILQAGGFNGGYIIVDDFERIPDFQSEKLKSQFANEIRTHFFDGTTANAKTGFLNLILIMHAGVHRLLKNSWSTSGMERRSPLSPDGEHQKHIIKFNALNAKSTLLLVKKYMSEFRIADYDKDSLWPFTEDSIKLISEKCELNAAQILEKCHLLIEKAIYDKQDIIDTEFVIRILDAKSSDEDLENIAEEESINLHDKAERKK